MDTNRQQRRGHRSVRRLAPCLAPWLATLLVSSILVIPAGVGAISTPAGSWIGAMVQQADTTCTAVWIGPTTGSAAWTSDANWSEAPLDDDLDADFSGGSFPSSGDAVCFGTEFGGTDVDGVRIAIPTDMPGVASLHMGATATMVLTSSAFRFFTVTGTADFSGVFADGLFLQSDDATIRAGRLGGVLPGVTANSGIRGNWTIESDGELHLGRSSVAHTTITSDGTITGVTPFFSSATISGGGMNITQFTAEESTIDLDSASEIVIQSMSIRAGTTFTTTSSVFAFGVDIADDSTLDLRGGRHVIGQLTIQESGGTVALSEPDSDVFASRMSTFGPADVTGSGSLATTQLEAYDTFTVAGASRFEVAPAPPSAPPAPDGEEEGEVRSTFYADVFVGDAATVSLSGNTALTSDALVEVSPAAALTLLDRTSTSIASPGEPVITGDNVTITGCLAVSLDGEWVDGSSRTFVQSAAGSPVVVDARLVAAAPFEGGELAFRLRPGELDGAVDQLDIVAQPGSGNPSTCDEVPETIEATGEPASVAEDADATVVEVTFTNTTTNDVTATVEIEPTGSQPVEDGDVTVSPTTVVVPAGTSTATFELFAPSDAVFEGDETGRIVFVGTSPEITGGIDVTVIDSTPRPSVIATPVAAAVLEGEPFVLAITTSGPSEIPLIAPVTLLPGGPDDADITDFVSIPPTISSTEAIMTILTVDDDLPEGDEAAVLTVDGIPISLTILDDDQAAGGLVLTGPPEPVAEGTSATYTLSLPAPAPGGMKVTWRVSFDPAELSGPPASALDLEALTGLAVAIPANATEITFDLGIVDDGITEPAESFLMIADVDGLLLDPSVETIIAASGAPADDDAVAIGQLIAGIEALTPALEGWGDLFDFTPTVWGVERDPVDLPVITDRLGSFAAMGEAARAVGDSVPRPAADDTLEDVVSQLDGDEDCDVLSVTRGVGGFPVAPSGDIVSVRCVRTLGQLTGAAGFVGDVWNDDTPDVLAELADSIGLDATGDLSLDTVVEITFGVDLDGFFVSASGTGITAQVNAELDVAGTGDVVGIADALITGDADADLTITIAPRSDGNPRLRLDQLSALDPDLVEVDVDGDASARLSVVDGDNRFDWSGTWFVTTPISAAPAVSTGIQELRALLALDGLSVGDVDTPDVLELEGVLAEGAWSLSGSMTQAALGGFRIVDATLDAVVDADGVQRLDATASLILDDRDPDVPVLADVELSTVGRDWSLDGTALFGSTELGPITATGVIVTVDLDSTGGSLGGQVAVSADSVEAFPDGPTSLTGTDVTGQLFGDGSVRFTAATLAGDVADGAVTFTASDAEVRLGPSFDDDAALQLANVELRFGALPDTIVDATGLVVLADGRAGVETATIRNDAVGVFDSAGLGGILPFDVSEVSLSFDEEIPGTDPPVRSLDSFDVEVTGSFDQEALGLLPFIPRIGLGGSVVTPTSDPTDNVFTFSVAVESLSDGVIRPIDLGPITLGVEDLELGDVGLAAELTIDGWRDGELQRGVDGTFEIESGFEAVDTPADLSVTLSGRIVDGVLQIDATFALSATYAGVRLDELSLDVRLEIGDVDGDGGFGSTFTVVRTAIAGLEIPIGDLATAIGGDVDVVFDRQPGDPIIVVGGSPEDAVGTPNGGLGLRFDDLDALSGWTGRVGGFAVCDGGSVHLGPEAFAVVDPPADERFGLPDEVPLVVRKAGLVLVTAADGDGPCEGPTVDDITDLRVRFSGGVEANETFPLTFELDELEVSLARLTGLEPGFPITNLDGIRAGMSPQEIAPGVRLGGLIGFGTVPIEGDDVWYVQVEGLLGVGDLELGGTAVITEYGPVAISISSPVGIPLGPTGLVLASVSGGVRFNDPLPEIEDPMDLLGLDIAVGPGSIGLDEIAAAIEPIVTDGIPVWERPFTIAVTGHLTSIASPGLAGGDVSVGINVGFGDDAGLKLIGRGNIDAFGIDVGGGGMLIDFADPIAPRIDVAFALPGPDAGPLALIMPSEGTMTMRIDTTGVADAALIGLRTFIEQVAEGTLELAADRFEVMLDGLAADLDDNRFRPLAQLLLDTDDNGIVDAAEGAEVIDRDLLLDRLLSLLPSDPSEAAELLERAPDLVNAVLGELIAAAEGLAVDPAELSADLLAAVGTARADLVALIEVVRTALVDAGVAALDVFAPSLHLEGSLQPLLLGIPFGEPEAGAALTIDRSGITLGFTVSINALLQRLANMIVPVVGGAIQSLLSLGATDRTTFDAQLPVGGFVESLITGTTLPTVDPDDGRWAISGQSRLGLFGTELVAADILITAPDNDLFIEEQVQLLFDPATGAPLDLSVVDIDQDRVPISTPEQLDALLEFGGILVAGRVEVPGMIVDPVSVIGGIDEPPEDFDAVESLAWLRQVVERITVPATPLRAVAFFPSPETIIIEQLDEFGDDRFSFDTAGPAAVARLERWLGAAFFEGVYDGLLLSMPIAKVRVTASTQGIEVDGRIPLLGIDGRITIGVREQTFADAVTLPVPTAELEVTIDALAEAGLLAQLGLPDAIGLEAGSVTARAVSPGFDIDSSDELERNGGIRVTALGDIDGLVENATFEVTVLPQLIGPAGLDVAVGVDRIGPLLGTELTNARLSFSSRLGSWSGALSGRLSVLGVTATVDGSIDIGVGDGFDARLRLGIAGGAKPEVGGLALDGRLDLVLSLGASGVLVGLDFDTTTPFAGSTIDIDGTLRAGIPSGLSGSLSVGVPPGGLPLGGSTSPFVITGALSLTVEPGLVEFSATDAGFRWRSGTRTIARFVVDEFSLGTDASVSIDFEGFTFSDTSGFGFTIPDVDLEAGPGLSGLRLVLGAGELRLPGIADGSPSRPALKTPVINVDTTSDFRRVLAAGTLDLGLLLVTGRLVFEGTDGVFRLAIEPLASNRPATLTIAGLGTLRLDGTAFVASNGTFDIGVSSSRLGSGLVSLRNVSARFSKTTTSFSSLSLRVNGGQIAFPVGDPVPLPNLSVTPFAMSGSQRFDETITLPSIDLGPALSISSARLRFRQLSSGALQLDVTNPSSSRPTVSVLGGTQTLTLDRLRVTSTGTFDGAITGRLTLFGTRLASATLDLTLQPATSTSPPVAKLTLPEARAAEFNLGFVKADLFGSVSSNGTFSFTSSLEVDLDIAIASLTGSVSATISNAGVSGEFEGEACVFGVGCASVDGSMSSTGFVDATVGFDLNNNGIKETFFDVSFQLGTAPPQDRNRPSMTVPRDIVVEPQSLNAGRAIVNYPVPTATDDRDGVVPVTCSPASGTRFVVGDTEVTCRASDRAGNTRTRRFTVTVLPPPPIKIELVLAPGASQTVTTGRTFTPRTSVVLKLFSDPIELTTVTSNADGTATWTVSIPSEVPVGLHTLQFEGVDDDDVTRFVTYTVDVLAAPATAPPGAPPGQPGVPTTQLPATGGNSTMSILLAALVCLVLGALGLRLRRRATECATEWV